MLKSTKTKQSSIAQSQRGNRTNMRTTTKPNCQLLPLKEVPLPDGCTEVMEFAKSRFTSREQWGFLRSWIEWYALECCPIEIPFPDGCTEVMEFAKSQVTSREQWGFLRLWVEWYGLPPCPVEESPQLKHFEQEDRRSGP